MLSHDMHMPLLRSLIFILLWIGYKHHAPTELNLTDVELIFLLTSSL